MPEEAVKITPQNIEDISDAYDVDPGVLSSKVGWYFVGEIDCDYWYAILSSRSFHQRYAWVPNTKGELFQRVSRRVLSIA